MFDFFEDDTVIEVVENHRAEILKLENDEAERVMRLYQKIRRELRDRLDLLGRGTFTEQKVRGTLVQVEDAIKAMSEKLKDGMADASDRAADKGLKHLIREINKFNKEFTGAVIPMNVDAAVIASDTSNFLVNKYEASINAYSEAVRSKITQSLMESAIQQKSYSEVVSDLGRSFIGEEWKLHQIARTELHGVYSQGKLRGMQELWGEGNGTIPDLKKTLFHPMDARTGKDSQWLERHNLIVPVDEPFEYTYAKMHRVFMTPPDRPNDRSIMIPYREAWQK